MPRRGWRAVEAPAGWFEVIRGPRPPSVSWPRATQGVQQRQHQPVDPPRNQRRRAPVVAPQKSVAMQGPRKSPEEIQASAQASIIRLERALAFLDESDVFAREALGGSLKRARSQAATVPVQDRLKSGEEFVLRAQKRLSQAEVAVTGAVEHRDRMKEEFEEGQRRLANLQAEAQNPPAPIPPVGEMEAEIRRLREHVAELEGTSVAQERPRVRQRVSSTSQVGFLPPMPTLVPGELFTWMEDRQTDLQDALISGDTSRVLELTSKMTEGAEHLREITSSVRMVP